MSGVSNIRGGGGEGLISRGEDYSTNTKAVAHFHRDAQHAQCRLENGEKMCLVPLVQISTIASRFKWVIQQLIWDWASCQMILLSTQNIRAVMRTYSPPQVDRIWGIVGSFYNLPKAIFHSV